MGVIPCNRGRECSWPACALDCEGRPGQSSSIPGTEYDDYLHRASALASDLLDDMPNDRGAAEKLLTEALCGFAEASCNFDRKRTRILTSRVVRAYDSVKEADENETPGAVDQYEWLDRAVNGLRSV